MKSRPFCPKRQGEIAELAFFHKASSLGYAVAKPYGDSLPYDFLLDARGRLVRVQVKSVSVADRGSYRVACSGGGARKHPYSPREVDILAAYVLPHDAWYLIPVRAISPRVAIRLCPHRPSRRRFERFREAWLSAFGRPLLCQNSSQQAYLRRCKPA